MGNCCKSSESSDSLKYKKEKEREAKWWMNYHTSRNIDIRYHNEWMNRHTCEEGEEKEEDERSNKMIF